MKMLAFLVAAGFVLVLGCTDLSSECAKATPTPDGDCTSDNLQCPFELDQPNCDGTSTAIETSCTCTSGAWACPSAVPCADDSGATE